MARACGGCQLQELDYREQLRFKERKVYNHLKRIGGMDRLFLPEDREKAAGVLDAVVDGTVSEERFNDSRRRIYRVKLKSRVL